MGKTFRIALVSVLVGAMFYGGTLTVRGVMHYELRFWKN